MAETVDTLWLRKIAGSRDDTEGQATHERSCDLSTEDSVTLERDRDQSRGATGSSVISCSMNHWLFRVQASL